MRTTVLRVTAVISLLVAILSAVSALQPQAQTTATPLIVLATVPPTPSPLPALRLPNRDLLAPGDTSAAGTMTGAADSSIAVSEGTLGVVLAGENSQATVLTSQGTKFVHIGSNLDGKTVVDISVQGVRLSDGRLIGRGLGVSIPGAPSTNGSMDGPITPIVPAIAATEPPGSLGTPALSPPSVAQPPAHAGPQPPAESQPPTPFATPWSIPNGPSMSTQTNGFAPPQGVTQLNPFSLPTPAPVNGGPQQ